MRIGTRTMLPALSGLILLAACGSGYGRTGVATNSQLGPGIDLYGYSADQYGDWRSSYRQWTPTMVYEYNGQYYPNNMRGARSVQVYRSPSGYFLPPRDQAWARTDTRFDVRRVPTEADYGRARSRPRPRP